MIFGDMPKDYYPDPDKELSDLAGDEPWVTQKKLDTAFQIGLTPEDMVKMRMELEDTEDRKEFDDFLEGKKRSLSDSLMEKLSHNAKKEGM